MHTTRRGSGVPRGHAARALAAIIMAWVACGPALARYQDSQPPAAPPARQPRQKPKSAPPPAPEAPAEAPAETPAAPGKATPPAPGQSSAPAGPIAKPGAAAPARKAPTEPGPYLQHVEQPRDYTLTVNVDVKSDRSDARDGNNQPVIGQFKFDSLAMVFPIVRDTSNAKVLERSILGTLRIDDREMTDTKPALIDKQLTGPLYHSGTRLLRFNTENPATCRRIRLDFTVQMSLRQTKFMETEAMTVDWPTGPWPATAAATLEPQMFIDYERSRDPNGPLQAFYETDQLNAAVKQWTNGDPKKAGPVALAKYIAGRMIAEFQPSGRGLQYLATGQLQGFNLQGVSETLRRRQGSDFDLASVLVAAYRAAGLPARLVIGIDDGLAGAQKTIFTGENTTQQLRCWVEFCLYDEPKNTVNWVPVDLAKMRAASSRPGPFERPWPYFGSHDEMDHMAPLAFGFHPPTTVESYGAPGLWGWMMNPQPPTVAYQALRFRIDTTAKRGGDKNKPKGDDDNSNDQNKTKKKR